MSERRLPFLSYITSFSAPAESFFFSAQQYFLLYHFLARAKRAVLRQPVYLPKPVLVTTRNHRDYSKASVKETSDVLSACSTLDFSLFTPPILTPSVGHNKTPKEAQSKAKQSIATLDLSGWNDPCEESEPLRGAGD